MAQQDIYSDRTTNIRLRIVNAATKYEWVGDVNVKNKDASNISVQVPAASGYELQAFSYRYEGGKWSDYLKDGSVGNITVVANEATKVDLVLKRPQVRLNLPQAVEPEKPFNISLSGLPSMLKFSSCYATASLNLFSRNYFVTEMPDKVFKDGIATLVAPKGPEKIFVYVNCIADVTSTSFYNVGGPRRFDYFIPNLELGEPAPSINILNPPGTINIGIGY